MVFLMSPYKIQCRSYRFRDERHRENFAKKRFDTIDGSGSDVARIWFTVGWNVLQAQRFGHAGTETTSSPFRVAGIIARDISVHVTVVVGEVFRTDEKGLSPVGVLSLTLLRVSANDMFCVILHFGFLPLESNVDRIPGKLYHFHCDRYTLGRIRNTFYCYAQFQSIMRMTVYHCNCVAKFLTFVLE
ncbi:hypothetical protein HNY73_007844 [Argiope bruennichi]|uniref:Uncharacterized protein n=1 Tax=Argiope bruennichi TaxID=94029 RepID=A0A8T0F9F9_ARGBR|nr:hypothetical protein HNY73_007844 [Argiope bruennichi]